MTAETARIEIPEFAQVNSKPELRLVLPLIELPESLKADSATEIGRTEPVEIIDHVPGFSPAAETLKIEPFASAGEYTGGDIKRIAARSGVPEEVVARAALESMARQRNQT